MTHKRCSTKKVVWVLVVRIPGIVYYPFGLSLKVTSETLCALICKRAMHGCPGAAFEEGIRKCHFGQRTGLPSNSAGKQLVVISESEAELLL